MPRCGADDFVGLKTEPLLPKSRFELITVERGGRGWEIHGSSIGSGVPTMTGQQELVKYSGHAVHFVTGVTIVDSMPLGSAIQLLRPLDIGEKRVKGSGYVPNKEL